MKSIAIFMVLLLVDTSRQTRQHEGKYYNTGYYNGPPPPQTYYNNKNHNKNNYYEANNDEEIEMDPAKIPTLMGPKNAIGLLSDMEQSSSDRCFPPSVCDASAPYRTMNGACNNLQFPVWGQSGTSFIRIIQADYADGVSALRRSKSGRELPNSRIIRTTIFKDANENSAKNNLQVMQFGQMIAHDTEENLPKTSRNGDTLECCNPDGSTLKNMPKECLAIKVPPGDPFPKKRCLSTPRSADTTDKGCNIQPVRQQIGVTSFLDVSLLYGSNDNTAQSLRSFVDGKLKKQVGPYGKSFLPNVPKATQVCNVAKDNTVCYATGDSRVNQNPNMAVQTISLLRLHNYLCDQLMEINDHWDDERLYQEARRLLIAMYQHVTYNEFLPILVGKNYAENNMLMPLREDYNDGYDVTLNPTTLASFAAGAYRALHSYIQGFLDMFNEARKLTGKIRLSDFFQRVDIVQKNDNYDSFYRGLLTQNAHEQDQYITKEVSEFMDKGPNRTDGIDLISLDMERGRDFGLPSYNKMRQLCGLNKANSFYDLSDQISQKNIDLLASLYEHVDDIDFYAGGMLEKKKPGAILGHTFQCITGEMFFRWKYGDRFFYEFGNQAGSFTLDQLQEIRKTTLALIVCLTSDIRSVQRNAFELPSHQNPLVSCQHIPNLDFMHWNEEVPA